MNIKIIKAMVKNKLFLTYEYIQKERDVENKIATSSDAPIHDDLRNAFYKLIPHLVLICEEEKLEEPNLSDELLNKYTVTGFKLSGSNGGESVVISGYKKLSSDKIVNFNTPEVKFSESKPERAYEWITELRDDIELIKEEVAEYMNGKQAPRNQIPMFADEEFENKPFEMQEEEM